MKIGIITIHYGINYGSALQCYALSKYLSNKNKYVKVINYIPPRYTKKNRYFKSRYVKNKKLLVLRLLATMPIKFFYQRIFDKFLNNNIPLSKKYYNISQINNAFKDYDLLITGSDQVWNTDYNNGIDNLYYLDFGNSKSKKISYAASSGKTEFKTNELKKCCKLWENLDGISVRESSLKQLLESNNIQNPKLVLDPIFLLNKNEWKNIASNRRINEPYVFIYSLDGDINSSIIIANRIAKKYGFKIVMISYGHIWSKNKDVDYYLKYKSPTDFISLIYNASYVVTNSFHGIAFSLRFEKQFTPIKREKYNSRLDSILTLVDLKNRLTNNVDNICYEKIDYRSINCILKKYEDQSKAYLDTWIEEK